MKKLILLSLIAIVFASCTDNERARSYGGTEEMSLEPYEKFVNITWKGANLWIIVQDTVTGDYYAKEKSSWGVWEGQIIVHPNKPNQPGLSWKDTVIKSEPDLSGWKPPTK